MNLYKNQYFHHNIPHFSIFTQSHFSLIFAVCINHVWCYAKSCEALKYLAGELSNTTVWLVKQVQYKRDREGVLKVNFNFINKYNKKENSYGIIYDILNKSITGNLIQMKYF